MDVAVESLRPYILRLAILSNLQYFAPPIESGNHKQSWDRDCDIVKVVLVINPLSALIFAFDFINAELHFVFTEPKLILI